MTSTFATTWNQQEPFLTALDALERLQWSVFPLDEEKRPPQMGDTYEDGKPKRLGWKQLQNRRPAVKELQFWQKTYNPCAWAVITGAISRVIILDFDGEVGRETCRKLGLRAHVQTGSGGFHVYFVHPGWHVPTLNGKSKRALGEQWPGLDIRGDGGYAAFCGSNSHGPYVWLRDPTPDDLSSLPDELRAMLGLLQKLESDSTSQLPPSVFGFEFKQPILQQLPAQRLHLAEERLAKALKNAETGRNNAGFRLACELRDHKYGWEQAEAMMREYVQRVSQLNSKGQLEPYTEGEAMNSLASAYRRTSASSGSVDAADLPNIILTGVQLRETVDLCIKAIQRRQVGNPWLFLRSARLAMVTTDELGRPRIQDMGLTHVTEELCQSANFFNAKTLLNKDKQTIYTTARPPREVSEQILARVNQRGCRLFPPLVGLTEVPILRPDGSICDQPGYDPQTLLYYMPSAKSKPCHVPTNPTSQDVKKALDLIWDAFGEFCYASEADRANTLALLMTPIIRSAITGDVPLAMIDASKPGSGKGILANSVAIIATGRPAVMMTPPNTEEEWGKSLLAILMEGQTVICLDNVTGRLHSAKLDSILTSEFVQGRLLGQSATAQVANLATWIATGNNLQLGGDLARRSYWIRLDPKMSRPWTRTGFRHPNLVERLRQKRIEFIVALLTLIRVWYVSGQPLASGLPAMATFNPWVNTIGSILAYIEVPGFLNNQTQHYEVADETSMQWEIFLQAWHETFSSNWVKISDLVKLMNEQAAEQPSTEDQKVNLAEALPERLQLVFREKPSSFKISLGRELKKRVDECFGEDNLHLELGGKDRASITLWRVVANSAGSCLVNVEGKDQIVTQECAGSAGSCLGNSHRENGNISQENIHKEGGNLSQHYQHYQQCQGDGMLPSPSENQKSQQKTPVDASKLNSDKIVELLNYEVFATEDGEWEEFTI